MLCRAMLEKMPYMQKRHMDEFINVSHVNINDYQYSSICDFKKRTKSSFAFLGFFIFPSPSTRPNLKTEDCFK